jgi:predicted ArsR family transcriptional regulator
MNDDFASLVSGIGTLNEPTRRALYLYVASRRESVSREEVAEEMDVPLHSVKFHLDRLADEGLLDVEFRRLTDRTGPGAGRPSKLYRRSSRQLTVSLPERHYEVVGDVLAEAIEQSIACPPIAEAVRRAALTRGRLMAEAATTGGTDLERTAATLGRHGYEPQLSADGIVLSNCPFDRLAQQHTDLVCHLNLALIEGVLEGSGCTAVEAVLNPQPGLCCVQARAGGAGREPGSPVERLRRWEDMGAVWRVLARTPSNVTVSMLSCDAGEEMDRLVSDDPLLLAFIGDRDASDE